MPDLLLGWVPALPAAILLLRAGTAASSARDCTGRAALGGAVTQPRLKAAGKADPQAQAHRGRGWREIQVPLPRPLCLACTCCPTVPGRQEARLPAPPCRLCPQLLTPGWHGRGEGLTPTDARCRRLVLLLFLFGFAGCTCWLNVSAAALGSGGVINAIRLLFLCWRGLAGGAGGDPLNSQPLFSPVRLFRQHGPLLSPAHAMLCSRGGLGRAQAAAGSNRLTLPASGQPRGSPAEEHPPRWDASAPSSPLAAASLAAG